MLWLWIYMLFVFCFGENAYISFFNNAYSANWRLSSLVTFTIIINEAPYAKERALSALRFAWTCDLEGHNVRIWLFENGVYLAKSGQKPASGLINCGQMLQDLIKGGVEVKACIVCLEARGLVQSDLFEGVKIATVHELVEWTVSCDKVIVF
jgi:tRNA 2-thiouridine synthesizing protein D